MIHFKGKPNFFFFICCLFIGLNIGQEMKCTPRCVFGGWSTWTVCNASCDGIRYRRRLCVCPENRENEECDANYKDTECAGEPEIQEERCNESEKTEGCCNWEYKNKWSNCNSCCGGGSQWERQVCVCGNQVKGDEFCQFRPPPQQRNRTCNSQPCCELYEGPPYCHFANQQCSRMWGDLSCNCPHSIGALTVPSDVMACLPPTFSPGLPPDLCLEYYGGEGPLPPEYICLVETSSGSVSCKRYTVLLNASVPQYFSMCPNSSQVLKLPSCYDGWSNVSKCCNNKRWKIQTTSDSSKCYLPPDVIIEDCVSEGNCPLADWGQWSNCSSLTGTQWRKRLCSCANELDCPEHPIEEKKCYFVGLCDWATNANETFCDIQTNQKWLTPLCDCSSQGLASSLCDLSNCVGKPPISIANCSMDCETCKWKEEVSDCMGTCHHDDHHNYHDDYDYRYQNSHQKNYHGEYNYRYQNPHQKNYYGEYNYRYQNPHQENYYGEYNHRHQIPYQDDDDYRRPNKHLHPTVGYKKITRTCLCNGKISNQTKCKPELPSIEIKECILDCGCGVEEWSPWSKCSRKCGGGTRRRERECTCNIIILPDGSKRHEDGLTCNDLPLEQVEKCHNIPCPRCPVEWRKAQDWPVNPHRPLSHCTSHTWLSIISSSPLCEWDEIAQEWVAATLNIKASIPPPSPVSRARAFLFDKVVDKCEHWEKEGRKEIEKQARILASWNRYARLPKN